MHQRQNQPQSQRLHQQKFRHLLPYLLIPLLYLLLNPNPICQL